MNTKFNIGDTVYAINVVDGYVSRAQLVENASVNEKGVVYNLTTWKRVKESLCFNSFEEAKKNLIKMMVADFNDKLKIALDSVDETGWDDPYDDFE